jgi:hypothetical protein
MCLKPLALALHHREYLGHTTAILNNAVYQNAWKIEKPAKYCRYSQEHDQSQSKSHFASQKVCFQLFIGHRSLSSALRN